MNVRDLIPWGRASNQTPASYAGEQHPVLSLHREIDRVFDEMMRAFDEGSFGDRLSSLGSAWPKVEVADSDKEIRVIAEVPGLEQDDLEVTYADGVLTIAGEKKSETRDGERRFSEVRYGRFERRIPVGDEVEQDKVTAEFKNGVLKIALPKSPTAQSRVKRIPIH